MERENRSLRGAELRSTDARQLSGYAAVFDSVTDIGPFREKLQSGCFTRCLAGKPDVRALFNHDPSLILGRTTSGTLTLREDTRGLHFDCELPDTQAAQDLRQSIRRGDVDQCSFGFIARQDRWQDTADGPLRTLLDCDLLDVSVATFPAYSQTSCSVRQLWPSGIPVRVNLRTRIGSHVAGGGTYVMRRTVPETVLAMDGPLEAERMWLRCQLALLD
jgi:HK97 family phage prohead protease